MNTIGPCGILKFGRGALWLTAKSLSLSPFGKPPVSATKILWGQIAIAVLNVLATTWAATQWTAWRLGFQPQLGQPWFEIVPGMPVYLPPAFFWWWYAYDAYAPRIFLEGAGIAASGGFISIAVAVGMSGARDYDHRDIRIGPLGDTAPNQARPAA